MIDRQVARSPRSDGRERLLDAAERLFGQYGMEGVSLREIAAAAGHLNNSAVHYHFSDKDGLVTALFADRVGEVERRRQVALEAAGDPAGLDAATLFRLLWQPVIDYCAACGSRWFAQFHLSFHHRVDQPHHPITSDPERHPASFLIINRLEAHSNLPLDRFRHRLWLISVMFWAAYSRPLATLITDPARPTGFSLDETIAIAVGALSA